MRIGELSLEVPAHLNFLGHRNSQVSYDGALPGPPFGARVRGCLVGWSRLELVVHPLLRVPLAVAALLRDSALATLDAQMSGLHSPPGFPRARKTLDSASGRLPLPTNLQRQERPLVRPQRPPAPTQSPLETHPKPTLSGVKVETLRWDPAGARHSA